MAQLAPCPKWEGKGRVLADSPPVPRPQCYSAGHPYAMRFAATPANAATVPTASGPRDEKTTSFGPLMRQARAGAYSPSEPERTQAARCIPWLRFFATIRYRGGRTTTPCRASARHGVVFPIAMWIRWRYVPLCPPPPEPPPPVPPPPWL